MEDQRHTDPRQSEPLLRELIHAFPILVAQLDTHYRVRFASEGYRTWFGLDPREQVGRHVRDVMGHEAFDTLKPSFDTALQGTQAVYHGPVRYAHGGTRFIHGIYVPAFNDEGHVTGVRILANDVTEHRAVEEQLADQTLRSQTIVDNAIDGIITIDANGIMQSFNPAAERLFGYSAPEAIGRNVSMLMPDPHRSQHDHYIHRYRQTRDPQIIGKGREVTAIHRDGSPIEIRLAVAEFFLNREQHFVGFIHDITSRKQAERDAQEALDNLAHADRITAMGELASGLAHEISQPLTAIQATAEACGSMLQSDNPGASDRLVSAMDQIVQQSRRASDIIQELRSFVRKGESGEVSRHNPQSLISDVLPLLSSELERAGVAVEIIPEEPLCECVVNRVQVEQVLVNLIRNAIDAMSEQDGERLLRIRSRLRPEDHACEIDIEDTGPGIPEEHLKKLFNPFFTTKTQGMGQGLPICKSIIERHGGTLKAETPPGGGTIFRFTLPHEPQHTAEQKHE